MNQIYINAMESNLQDPIVMLTEAMNAVRDSDASKLEIVVKS